MSIVGKVKSYVGAYSVTDVRSLLHVDHEQISAVTEQISSDESKQKRVRAFGHLKPFLTADARAEEQAVYVPLVNRRGSPGSGADGNEGLVEHSLVDLLVERLSKTNLAATDAWKAHARVLKAMLDHRIKEKERGIFEDWANISLTSSGTPWEQTLSRGGRICSGGWRPNQESGATGAVSISSSCALSGAGYLPVLRNPAPARIEVRVHTEP
jgi:hemerythrin superfamily protein